MNTPSYAKCIAQYISVERWLFDWNEVKSAVSTDYNQSVGNFCLWCRTRITRIVESSTQ